MRERSAVAFVGTAVPDRPEFHGPAFNRAGQMFQDGLICGVERAGLVPLDVFSIEPIASFPRSPRLVGRSGMHQLANGRAVRLVPFLNLQPFKAMTAGISTLAALVGWAWRNRGRQRVIHMFNLTMPPGVFVWLAGRLTGSRVSVSALDVWKPGALVPDTWRWRFDFFMQRRLMPRFDGIMVVSKAIADDLVPGRRVCILEGGVQADRFPRDNHGDVSAAASTRPFRLVLSGSLESFNGLELAVAAMKLLSADVELVIAGSGTLAPLAREVADRDPRIRFLGFLPFEEVLDLYQSADLLLNARVTKAIDTRYFFPSKLMELLASGTPVLSTCTGHVESEYGHVLYLLRDETPEALAARIEEIRAVADDERRELGRRAREFMLTEKTWQRQGERLADYLRREVLRVA